LAIHGWMDNAASFDKLIPFLSDSFYVVAIDLPGHGWGSHLPPGSAYHFGDYIITIKRIAAHMKWEKFNILGHSLGAGLGVYFSSVYPSMVDKLIMIDMIKPMSTDSGSTPEAMAAGLNEFLEMEGRLNIEMSKSFTHEEAVTRWIMAADFNTDGDEDNHSLTRESVELLLARATVRVDADKWSFRHDPRVRCASIYTLSHKQSVNFVRGLTCHLLILKADKGPTLWGPPDLIKETLETYKRNCRSFRYEVVEGTHFVHLNDPTKVATLINDYFLK